MDLQARIELLGQLRNYLTDHSAEWEAVKEQAHWHNPWFTPEFIDHAVQQICTYYLDESLLKQWIEHYHIDDNIQPKTVGIIMAGNIPLVGFHDFLCVFICGHYQKIKLSGKDEKLFPHLLKKLTEWNPEMEKYAQIQVQLKNCDAYIATGSNNTSRYFEYYFSKYPHIIRKNKTSAAILTGQETESELHQLAHDVHLYFGRGCRNVTHLYVPENYPFETLLNAFKHYDWMANNQRYKNNYDYQLAILLLNGQYYMSNGNIILVEQQDGVPPISMVYYSYYPKDHPAQLNDELYQCVTGYQAQPFGSGQQPTLYQYADNVDTMQFLLSL